MREIDVAIEAALAGGRAILEAGRPTEVRFKGEVDLVSEVDLASEHAIRAVLARHTPDIAVLGEEEGGSQGATRWLVDPLDGTTNFLHGIPWWCVSVALQVDGELVAGVLYDPSRDLTFRAAKGEGAWSGDRALRVSTEPVMRNALVATGFPVGVRDRAEDLVAPVARALRQCRGVRRMGSAALDLALVASGVLDAYFEELLGPWDVAAGVLLVREAGGRVTDLSGGPFELDAPRPLASNGLLHQAMCELISG